MQKFAPILACVLGIPLLLCAQKLTPREESLLLPFEQHVSGIVIDSSARPIAGASVQHAGEPNVEIVTDSSGHFELTTRVPAFVIRKVGFESAFVRTENAQSIRITLRQSQGALPKCLSKVPCSSVEGWACIFCFPHISGVKISAQKNDIDYGQRVFSVRSNHGMRAMQHAGGPMWGAGLPFDEDVWDSVVYSEKTYALGEGLVVDARGRTKSGKFWRSIGRFGEGASYHDLDHESAIRLDRVLDGLCIREGRRKQEYYRQW
jgi:hypothetical protein